MKKFIIGIIIGILVSTTGVLAATYLYKASDVEYTPQDDNWNVDNVQGAISDLYSSISQLSQKPNFVSFGFYGSTSYTGLYAIYSNVDGSSFMEYTGSDFDKLEESDLVDVATKGTYVDPRWNSQFGTISLTCAKAGYYFIGGSYVNPGQIVYKNVGDVLMEAGAGGEYTWHFALYLGDTNPYAN